MKDGFVISVWKKKQLGQNRSTPYLLYYFLVVFQGGHLICTTPAEALLPPIPEESPCCQPPAGP